MKILVAQLHSEVRVIARNAEQLLVIIGIPCVLLLFFSQIDLIPTGNQSSVDLLVPGILSLAIMSTAMVSLGIATGFERSYAVLKRLGATPLGKGRLIIAKSLTVVIIEIVQVAVIIIIGVGLGLTTNGIDGVLLVVALVLGTFGFAGVGLLIAGTIRAETNLALQNGLYVVLLVLGGVIVPLNELPRPMHDVGRMLPSGALSDVLRDVVTNSGLHGTSSWIVLSCWAVVAPLTASKFFRWT